MPNNYTISPGTVVGNQSVTGDLLVTGRIIGSRGATQFVHLENQGGSLVGGFGMNVGRDLVTRDDNTKAAFYLYGIDQDLAPGFRRVTAVVTTVDHPLLSCPFYQIGSNINTGNTTENTIYSTTIRGRTLGSNGRLRVSAWWNTTVQGGVASTCRVRLAGTVVSSAVVSAVSAFYFMVEVGNRGSYTSNQIYALVIANGVTPVVGQQLLALDLSVDQTLSVTMQNGAATDSHRFEYATSDLISTGVQV